MFSATQNKVLSIYTYWYISVFISSHVSPLNCYCSSPKKWGFAGCKVWVKSWIGKTFPAVCTEADESILDAQFPDHGATVKKAISDMMRRRKPRWAGRWKHEDLNYSLVRSNTFSNKYPCHKLSYDTRWTFIVFVIPQTVLNITIQDTNHLIILLLLLRFLKFSALLTFLLFLFNSSF